MTEYNTMDAEEAAREAFVQGYDAGKSKERLNKTELKTANALFDQWWERNYN